MPSEQAALCAPLQVPNDLMRHLGSRATVCTQEGPGQARACPSPPLGHLKWSHCLLPGCLRTPRTQGGQPAWCRRLTHALHLRHCQAGAPADCGLGRARRMCGSAVHVLRAGACCIAVAFICVLAPVSSVGTLRWYRCRPAVVERNRAPHESCANHCSHAADDAAVRGATALSWPQRKLNYAPLKHRLACESPD